MKRGALQFGISLSDFQMDQFQAYMVEMLSWNEKMNLTTITEKKDIAVKHFLDSISLCSVIDNWDIRVLDIGTGAGFPGIPLKIVKENIQLVLMDSIRKKTDFLAHLRSILNIQYDVLCMRAEDGAKESSLRETFGLVVSRAVAKMPVLAEYCLPYVSVGGYFIAMKSESAEDEVYESKNAIHILGGAEAEIHRIELKEFTIARSLVIVKKINHSPEKYPRRAGLPEKRPL
jgi:16S rRNA (guanine527-N7)-methyltransferase